MKKVIEVFEYEKLKVGDTYSEVKISQKHFDVLVQWNEKMGGKFLSSGYKSLSFKNYVGVIRVKDISIEILPKADKPAEKDSDKTAEEIADNFQDKNTTTEKSQWRKALIYMLSVVNDLKIDPSTPAFLKTKNISLMDFFIKMFIKETHTIIHKGLLKKYRQIDKNSSFIKGKILFQENIKRNLLNKEKCFVRMSTYDYQNIYNAILKTAITILRSTYFLQKSTYDELNNLNLFLENIKSIAAKKIEWSYLSYNRKNDHYKKALNLARLIIENSTPEIRAGKNEIIAFLFDMNKLFEKFIAKQCLRASKEMTDVKVHSQNKKTFWKSQTIKPDLVFQLNKENRIADTKWKLVKSEPSSEDLRQMYVYNIYWQSCMAFLIYPSQEIGEENFVTDNFKNPTQWLENFQHGVAILPVNIFKEDGINKENGIELNKNIGRDIIETIEGKS